MNVVDLDGDYLGRIVDIRAVRGVNKIRSGLRRGKVDPCAVYAVNNFAARKRSVFVGFHDVHFYALVRDVGFGRKAFFVKVSELCKSDDFFRRRNALVKRVKAFVFGKDFDFFNMLKFNKGT